MKFEQPKCPQCGSWPKCTIEKVMGQALLCEPNLDGTSPEFEWEGSTDIWWDSQETVESADGCVNLICAKCSAEWQTGMIDERLIVLPCYGIMVTLSDWNWRTKRAGGGSIESSLHEAVEQEGDDEEQAQVAVYNRQLDAIESMILAHAIAGIDVASPAYVEGITTAVEACANNH